MADEDPIGERERVNGIGALTKFQFEPMVWRFLQSG